MKGHSLVLLLIIVLIWSCEDEAVFTHKKDLRIGMLVPLTGAGASPGESAVAGAELALEDVEAYLAATGAGFEVEIVMRDTETDAAVALEKLQDLAGEGIDIVIGPYASANVWAVLDYANSNDILLLSPASVASALAVAGDNLYRLIPGDGAQAEAITALWAHDSLELIVPVVRDDAFGDGLLSDVGPLATQQGIELSNAILYDPDAVDASAIAAQLDAAIGVATAQHSLDRIGAYMIGFGEGTDILTAASGLSNAGAVIWYGSSAYANNAGLLQDMQALDFADDRGLLCPSFAPDPAVEDLWLPVEQQLESRLGRVPEVFALTTYDAVGLLLRTHQLCADPADSGEFIDCLEETAGFYNGITGRVTFDAFGDRKFASFDFWGVENGAAPSWVVRGFYNNSTGQLEVE